MFKSLLILRKSLFYNENNFLLISICLFIYNNVDFLKLLIILVKCEIFISNNINNKIGDKNGKC